MEKKQVFSIPNVLIFSFVLLVSVLLLVLVFLQTGEKEKSEPEALGVDISKQVSEIEAERVSTDYTPPTPEEITTQMTELENLKSAIGYTPPSPEERVTQMTELDELRPE